MKKLEYYLSLPYRFEIIPDVEEGGYTICYPDLPGCITCSETLDGLLVNAEDAKRVWIETALSDNIEIPEPKNTTGSAEYSGQFKLRMPKSLHRSLSEHAKEEGISMNQYCLYLLAKNDSLHHQSISTH